MFMTPITIDEENNWLDGAEEDEDREGAIDLGDEEDKGADSDDDEEI